MFLIFLIVIITLINALLLLLILNLSIRSDGAIGREHISIDLGNNPGMTLYSSSISLVGRPDYVIKEKDHIIPIEVKTGSTPSKPYANHIIQLMAYCFLIEENFQIQSPYGYIKYPGMEYKIAYTDEARNSVIDMVKEIQECKKHNKEFTCNHSYH